MRGGGGLFSPTSPRAHWIVPEQGENFDKKKFTQTEQTKQKNCCVLELCIENTQTEQTNKKIQLCIGVVYNKPNRQRKEKIVVYLSCV